MTRIPRLRKGLPLLLLTIALAGCAAFEFAPRDAATPPHHGPKSFVNIPIGPTYTLCMQLRGLLGLESGEPTVIPAGLLPPDFMVETVPPDLERIRRPDPASIQLTWIGHSTFLIQADGLNILTDPVFSRRASPFAFAGPTRLAPPGVELDDLPPIDAVLLSHNHYDHMDKATLQRLAGPPRVFVPLGHRRLLAAWGIFRVSELDWWQASTLGPLLIRAVPARHNSNRGLFDVDRALWAGWVVETRRGNLYFAGDTAAGPHFQEIAGRAGPIRLALLPIGAYGPRRQVRLVHTDPADAVQAHLDLGAEMSVAMHWGTFPLSPSPPSEPMAEPPLYLEMARKKAGLREGVFRLMKIGETILVR